MLKPVLKRNSVHASQAHCFGNNTKRDSQNKENEQK